MEHIIPQPAPQKQCTTCNQFFPATSDFFQRNKMGKYGLISTCKPCTKHKWRIAHPEAKVIGPRILSADIPEGHKQCTKCKEILPATMQYFSADHSVKASKSGLKPHCKQCIKRAYDEKYPKPFQQIEGMKRCNTCQEYKPATLEFFSAYTKVKDGLYSQCKPCRKLKRNKGRKPRKTMEEKIRYIQHYQETHRSHIKQYRQAYEKSHKEERRLYRQSRRAYRQANERTRRARKKSIQGTHTPKQIQDLLKRQKHKCYYCFTRFKKDEGRYVYHIEHTFPLSRVVGTDIPANDISYLVLSCKTCNLSKGKKFPWEWPEGNRLL